MTMCTYFGTLKLIIMIILWTSICLQDAQAIRNHFEVVQRCPFNVSEWKVRAAHTMCNGSESYHCLLTEGGVSLREQCTDASLFTSGYCPIFTKVGYLQWSACKDTACPTSSYRSDEVYQYQICYQKTDNPKEKNTEKGSNDSSSVTGVTIIVAILLAFVAFVLVSVFIIYRRNLCGFRYKVHQCMFDPHTHFQHRNDTEDQEDYPVENYELNDIVKNEKTVEQEPFLWIETENSLKSPPAIKHEGENVSGERKSGNFDSNADMDASDTLLEYFRDAPCSPTKIKQKNSEVSTDVQRKKMDEEKSAENASGLCIVSEISYNEEGDTPELTDVFDDTIESVRRIATPTDEQDRKLCLELYNLLDLEGQKLTQEVMAATISRETGKPVKILLNNLSEQEKNKLKAMLPEESHRVLESKTEHDTSFHVSYGLHRIILDEEKSPKSGWGNPVRGTDISISDDIERLYRIQTIVHDISNPVTVSVEIYIRLLDIMIEALTRLDLSAEFKEDYKLLCYKLKSIKNPNLTQTMLKMITNIVKEIW